MSKKENEHEVTSLLSRLRESLKRPKKDLEPEVIDESSPEDDLFERDLSDRLEKHLQGISEQDAEEMQESTEEVPFEVEELEIVAEGALDPAEAAQSLAVEEIASEEATVEQTDEKMAEIFSDLDALMARMTPEQRAVFEAEMNDVELGAADEAAEEVIPNEIPLSTEIDHAALDEADGADLDEPNDETESDAVELGESFFVLENQEDAVAEEPAATETAEEGEIYRAAETDEEYDLPDVEAFRALEARMTPEQRAQFEQALQEAQEAEQADREARRTERQTATQEIPNEPEVSDLPWEELPTEQAMPEVETLAEVESDTAVEVAVAEEVAIENELPLSEEASDTVAEDEPQLIYAPPVSEDEVPEENPIFMVADEEEDESDMPVIKVGSEPSAFTLVDPPEPEPEEEDEEALFASLLSRMTPEQLARFREEMLVKESEGNETDETPGAETEESVPVEEEQKVIFHTSDQPEEDERSYETADAPEPPAEDPIEAILRDPEKLDQLMERLSPEQAEELKRALNDEIPEEDEWESIDHSMEEQGEPAETFEEQPTFQYIIEDASPVEEEPEMTVLGSESMDEDSMNPDESAEDSAFDASGILHDGESSDEQMEDEDLYSMEISEDMTDDEISLMLGLGYEKELVYHLGAERVERVKMRAMRTETQDPEFADAYAYEGEEYRHTEQNERIRYRYGAERRHMLVRLGGTAFFALLLFLYECCGVFRNAFGGIFDPAHYPVIAIMAGWQLLIFASLFSWKKLIRGIRSAFLLEPNHHAMTAIIVAIVMFSNILMAIVFKGSALYLYNFPAALCLLCSVLCDFADVCREELTFDVISSDSKKYAAEAIVLNPAYTDAPAEVLDEENVNPLTAKNAMYVRRVGFVKNYFRRTGRKTRHAQILNFVFLPLLAFAVVLGIVTALIGNGTVASLNTFVVTVLLCMPLSYTVIHTLPLFYEARRLQKQNCAIVGESTVEESNQYSTVIFEDKELFPPVLIKTKGLKLYENNLIYSVILKISLLFREIGGPINDVLDLDKEEMKRFIASGQAGDLAEGKVELERMTEDGVIATLSDGSCVIAGTAEFLQSRGVYVNPSTKDRQLIESGEVSILYLAFDGELGARFYVDYQPDPEFEAMSSMLSEDGFRVAVRTLDPGIRDEMIVHKCGHDTSIHTVRATVRELTDKVSHEARVDSGLVCADDPRKMLLLFRAIRNLRRLNRFVLRLYGGALLLNMIVAIVLTACSVVGYMPSLLVSLYMLVWLSTSVVLTALFLNK